MVRICRRDGYVVMPLGANKVALFGVAGVSTGTAVLLSTATASDDASIEFTLPTAYKQVVFKCYEINPSVDTAQLSFDCSISGTYGSTTKTSTWFRAYHNEDDDNTGLLYNTNADLAQSASNQILLYHMGNAADESGAGELNLYNPASTTYVKHFSGRFSEYAATGNGYVYDSLIGGYINHTEALDGIKFIISSGTFDGKVKMWGVK